MLRLLLPLAFLAFQAPTVALAPTEGAKTVYASTLKLSVGGIAVDISSDVTHIYSKVSDADFTIEETTAKLMVDAGGNEMTPSVSPLKAVMGRDGTLKSIEGGIEGTSVAQTHLLFRFVPTPAEEGKTTTVELKGNGGDIPDQKVESTYTGAKKSGEADGFGYTQKTTAGELVATTDYVVKADGTILEASTKFTGLYIPAANSAADGSGTLKLKP